MTTFVEVFARAGDSVRAIARQMVFCALLASLASCESRTSTTYVWGGFVSEQHSLYVIRYTKKEESRGLPIPERGTPKLVEQRFEVVELNLDLGTARDVGVTVIPDEPLSRPWDMDFVTLDAGGRIGLRREEDVADALRRAGSISCDGHLDRDIQDSRVLYYVCLDRSAVFRFEPPYQSAKRISTSLESAVRFPRVGDLKFASVLGDKYVYAWGGKNLLFRIDLTSPDRATELDRFAPPRAPLELSTPQSRTGDEDSLASSLIAVAPGLRIHEVIRDTVIDILVIRPGAPDLTVVLPKKLRNSQHLTRRYIAKSQIVIWLIREPLHTEELFALDLLTGKFMQATLPSHP